jgi:hypothetical protein
MGGGIDHEKAGARLAPGGGRGGSGLAGGGPGGERRGAGSAGVRRRQPAGRDDAAIAEYPGDAGIARLPIRARDVALACARRKRPASRTCCAAASLGSAGSTGPFVEVNVAIDAGAAGDVRLTARLTRRAAETMPLAARREVFAPIKTIALDRVVQAGMRVPDDGSAAAG